MLKERNKRSQIWTLLTDSEFTDLVNRSATFTEIVIYFGLYAKGGNINTVKRRIKSLNILCPHIKTGKGSNKGKKPINSKKIPLSSILDGSNPQYKTFHLKNRLYSEGIKSKICESCGLGTLWNKKQIEHHLDHKNGNSRDHTLSNLQILCPNCHSQTETYAGKNKRQI